MEAYLIDFKIVSEDVFEIIRILAEKVSAQNIMRVSRRHFYITTL